MKKIFATICSIMIFTLFVSCALVGCSGGDEESNLDIVCTVFPVYDWVRNIVRDVENVKVTMLLDSGVDLHSYDPTVSDIVTVGKSDLFVYVGGESDEAWVDRVLAQKTNQNLVAVNLMEVLADRLLEEENPDESETEQSHDEVEYDEHVWLSLKNAEVSVRSIAEKLCSIDEENSAKYKSNAEDYIAGLDELDDAYAQMVASAKNDTLVFGDRFSFLYLVRDYNLNYFAAFSGCAAAEAGASAATLTSLAAKLDELDLDYILENEGSSNGIAKNIVALTATKSQQILKVNAMHAVTSAQVVDGADYLEIMRDNLSVFQTALN